MTVVYQKGSVMAKNIYSESQASQNDLRYLLGPCENKGIKIDLSDAKAKAKNLLLKHPEILHDGRHLFRNENGTTIVQEIVPRGDQGLPRVLNQGDLNDMDLKGLADYAAKLVDPCLLRYDRRVALEDALKKAIWEKDSGMYQGKVNTNTFCLLIDLMGNNTKNASGDTEEGNKEKPDKEPEEKKVVQVTEVTRKIMTPEQEAELKGEGTGDTKGVPESDKIKHRKFLERKEEEKSQEESDKPRRKKDKTNPEKENKKMDKAAALKKIEAMQKAIEEMRGVLASDDTEERTASEEVNGVAPIIDSLDKIAGELEETGDIELMKVAYGIDVVSDVLEGKKEAKVLEHDLDEKFMREYFKGGVREGEADEKKYMKQFDNDDSAAVENVKDKKSRTASEKTKRPYTRID